VRVLVTGGAGFIGHHIVRGLLGEGHEISVIDDLSTGFEWRLAPVLGRIRFVNGSVLRAEDLDRAAVGAEVILHLAAIPSVARSMVDPRATNDVNVGGTVEVMLAAARHGVRRVVLSGSSSVYGIPAVLPCVETMQPAPLSPYGASKIAAEHYLHTLGLASGVESLVLRYFNVFGPGQDRGSEYAAVVPRFVTAVLEGHRPQIYGDGLVSRDFTYVDNVVSANLLAMAAPIRPALTCNVAGGERHSLLRLLAAIESAAGRSSRPAFAPPRSGDIRDSQADITMAREALGYEVIVPFEEGIGRTVAWYRAARGEPVVAEPSSTTNL
jgi:UDP-glucose 4-epimerase